MSQMNWIRRRLRRSGSGDRSRGRRVGPQRRRPSRQQIVVDGAIASISSTPQALFHGHRPGDHQPRRRRSLGDRRCSSVSARIVDGRIVVIARRGRADHQSRRLRGQQQASRATSSPSRCSRRRARAFNEAVADADIERIKDAYKKIGRNATYGDLSAGAAAERPRRPRLQHRRRRQDRRPRDQLRRQQRHLRATACRA